VYLKVSTARNPFDKVYANVLAIEKGYIQFSTGKTADYCPSKPKSATLEAFKDVYAPE
jgi:hypothetical protein